ncbi:BatD family protein, partial [Candidatus Binatia bacterium]|nr:BatD family protein [Candidatus Binatia bacterium]
MPRRSTRRQQPSVRAGLVMAASLLALLVPAARAGAAIGNARMRAEVRPTEIQLGQSARLVVTISGVQNAPAPRIPAIDGLRVQSLGQTTSVQIINGSVTAEVTHNFLIEPERTGTFAIPALATEIEGERLSTSPLSLRVVDANTVPRNGIAPHGGGGSPTGGADPSQGQAQPISLRLTAPQRDLYVGEAVPVELTLLIREGVRVTEVTAPTFDGTGFTVSRPQDGQPSQTTEVIDGVRWVVATFPLAITPVSAGEFPLIAKMDVTAYLPGGRRRFGGVMDDPLFDSFFGGGAPRKIPLATEQRGVHVRPLPDAGRPASFAGAIGKFTVEASAAPTKLTVGDPVTLTIKVAGKGNFDRLTIPALDSGADWKTYPASSKFEPTDALGTSGRKISEQAIVPLTAKLQAIPARPFSYFDPDKQRYVELTTQPIALAIEGAPRAATGGAGTSAASGSQSGSRAAERGASDDEQWEIAPNQIAPGPAVDATPVVTRPWFLALQLLPIALLAAGSLWARRRDRLRTDPTHHRRLAARRRVEAEVELMQRAATAGDAGAFFAAARRAVQERLARDPDREAASLTLPELEALAGDRPELRDELRAIVP